MQRVNHKALARLAQIQRGEVPYPPMWRTVPLTLITIEAGMIEMEAVADERHINAMGTVHGGFVATVLDTVLGCSIYTSIGDDDRHTTVDLAVKIVKRIPLHIPLIAAATLVHVSRSVGVAQGVLRTVDGIIHAHGTTTCLIKR